MLTIIFRKLCIVVVVAFMGKKPLFAATVVVLILFVAYALQVQINQACCGCVLSHV
jgi:hypothetical protein